MYLRQEVINQIVIEKSKFICYMKHIENEDDFKQYLTSIKKKHYDASHHCSGLIIDNIKRSSDDGEPAGTAGAPILNVLEKSNLNKMCAIVVRYFGGIKLGAGGLIRAYSSAVSETIAKGQLVQDLSYPEYQLSLSYELANKIKHYMENSTILIDTIYDEYITYIFALDDLNKIETIKQYTKGIEPIYTKEKIIQVEVK